jgi:hypothetical protein
MIDEITTKSRPTDAARSRRWTLGIVYEVPIEWFAKELSPAGKRARLTFVLFKKVESLTQKVGTVNICAQISKHCYARSLRRVSIKARIHEQLPIITQSH